MSITTGSITECVSKNGSIMKKAMLAAFAGGLFLLAGCAFMQEGRAVWVVRYRLAEPGAVARIVSDAEASNLNALFVQVHGRADAYYSSEIEPRSEALAGLPAHYDPLKVVVESGHAAGLEVHAWVNAYYAWNRPPPMPLSPRHVVNRRPAWLITDDEGRRIDRYTREEMARRWVEGLYLDPASEEVRDYLVKVCAEIASKYPVDGVHLDFIRYPGSGFGFSADSRAKFAARFGVEPLLLSEKARYLQPDPGVWLTGRASIIDRWNHYYYALWNAEKARAISDTVGRIYDAVKRVRPGVVLTAAVLPDPDKAYYQFSQDWRRWLREGYLDIVLPMAYYGDIDRVRSQVRAASAVAGRGRVYAGLGAWIKDQSVISKEIEMLREEGVKGFSLFSYKGMADRGPYLRDLRYSSIPLGLRFPRVAARSEERVAVAAGRERVIEWINGRYDWSTVSGEVSAEIGLRLRRKKRGLFAEQALLKTAMAAGVRAREAEVSSYIEALAGEFYSREQFARSLDRLKMSPLELKRFMEQEIVLYKYITTNLYPAALPAPEHEVLVPAGAEISLILRVVHPRDGEERRAAARKLMEEILHKLDAGEDFARLAREYSQGGSAGYGGRAGTIYYRPGDRISEAIFSLKEGQHSRVVDGNSGFLIYRVNSLQPPYQAEYQSLPWKLRRFLFQERLAGSIENWATEAQR